MRFAPLRGLKVCLIKKATGDDPGGLFSFKSALWCLRPQGFTQQLHAFFSGPGLIVRVEQDVAELVGNDVPGQNLFARVFDPLTPLARSRKGYPKKVSLLYHFSGWLLQLRFGGCVEDPRLY